MFPSLPKSGQWKANSFWRVPPTPVCLSDCPDVQRKAASGRLTAFGAFCEEGCVSLIARMLSAGQKRMQLKSDRRELLVKEK